MRFYYFTIGNKNEEGYFQSTLVKQKIEINNRAFETKDIFGMENFLKQDQQNEEDKLCIICCAKQSNILILPCLHLNICAECITEINKRKKMEVEAWSRTDRKKPRPQDKNCPICNTSKRVLIYRDGVVDQIERT